MMRLLSRQTIALSFALVAVACGSSPAPAPKTEAPPSASSPSSPAPAPAPAPSPASASPSSDASPTTASDTQAKPAAKPTKITARHVLIQWMGCDHAGPSVVRTRDQALAVAEDVLRRAKAGEDFARLAVEFSDEPNAGQRGGSLGRFGHGQMVKAFEEAAFALKPGEISGVVETGFGFHVIQRTE
jgi:NIMA-interacting peptidyl-prolyl cis-trans isomerase 1